MGTDATSATPSTETLPDGQAPVGLSKKDKSKPRRGSPTLTNSGVNSMLRASFQGEVYTGKYAKYYQFRRGVYNFLELPSRRIPIVYHSSVFFLIVCSFLFSVMQTIVPYDTNKTFLDFVAIYEICLLSIFVIECLLRFWSCSTNKKFRGCRGKLRFLVNFYMIIDIISIAATVGAIVPYYVLEGSNIFELSMIRITRFVQIFRIMRIDRQRGDFAKMTRLIFKHNRELLTSYYIGFMVLILSAFGVYMAEDQMSNDSGKIPNLADGLYWGIITVTTVGYGDYSPTGWVGKLITSVFAIVGSALFAIPIGIISSGFALEVAKERRKRKEKSVKDPAAFLIQSWWKRKKALREFNNFVKFHNAIQTEQARLRNEAIQKRQTEVNGGLKVGFGSTLRSSFRMLRRGSAQPTKPIPTMVQGSNNNPALSSHPSFARRHTTADAFGGLVNSVTHNNDIANDVATPLDIHEEIRNEIEMKTMVDGHFAGTVKDTRNQQLASLFFLILREASAAAKFERAKRPFIALEDVIALLQKMQMQFLGRLKCIETAVESENLSGKIDLLNEKVKLLETQIKRVAEEKTRENDRRMHLCTRCRTSVTATVQPLTAGQQSTAGHHHPVATVIGQTIEEVAEQT